MLVNSADVGNVCARDDMHKEIVNTLKELYQQNELFDVTISCLDGATVQAHKLVLVSFSKYFRTLFTGSLPQDSKVGQSMVSLPFSSTSVKIFLDFIYQSVSLDGSYSVDAIECSMLLDFLDLFDSSCSAEVIRLAATYLTPENCISELNKVILQKSDTISHWITVILCYIFRMYELSDEVFDDMIFKELSKESLITIFSSDYMKYSSVGFVSALLMHMRDLERQLVEDNMLEKVLSFIPIGHISRILNVFVNLSDLQRDYLQLKVSDGDVQERYKGTVKNSYECEEIVIGTMSGPPCFQVSFSFCPKEWKLVEQYQRRFSRLRTKFSNSFSNLRGLDCYVKFFTRFNSLFAVLCKNEEEMQLLQYKGEQISWICILEVPLPSNEEGVVCCLQFDDKIFVSFGLILVIIDVSTTMPATKIVSRLDLDFFVNDIIAEGKTVVLLNNPARALTLENYIHCKSDSIPIVTPSKHVPFGCVITFLRKTFNIYSLEEKIGIFIDLFNFDRMEWEEVSSNLTDHKAVDAFVANDKLYILCEVTENNCEGCDKCEEECKSRWVLIKECICKELDKQGFAFYFAEKPDLEIPSDVYGYDHIRELITVRQNLFIFNELDVPSSEI